MRIADSRVFGLFPLQHQGYKDKHWDLDKRSSIFGIRILDRLDKPGDVGHWLYDPQSVGDIHGGQLFKPDGKKRETPMWRFATGVVVTRPGNPPVATPGGGGRPPVATPGASSKPGPKQPPSVATLFRSGPGTAFQGGREAFGFGEPSPGIGPNSGTGTGVLNGTVPTEGGTPAGPSVGEGSGNVPTEPNRGNGGGAAPLMKSATCRPLIGQMSVHPILDENYGPDLRLAPLNPSILKIGGKNIMSKPPVGFLGITLTGNEENRQVDLFFPTDNRLIAVNFGGDVLCGSLVFDLTPDSELDPDRRAPLQALTWVIKRPQGDANTLAWNIGPSGCEDVHGGYVIDDAENGGNPQGKNPPVATPGRAPRTPGSGGDVDTRVMPLPGQGNGPVQPPPAGPNGGIGGRKAKIVARVNRRFKGPFDVGTGHCLHFTGETDDDDHRIMPLHIQHQFLMREDDVKCGPLNITEWKRGDKYEKNVIVNFGWNPFIRKWDWYTTTPIHYAPVPPPTVPPPTTTPGTSRPGVPTVDPRFPGVPVSTTGGTPAAPVVTPPTVRPVGGDLPIDRGGTGAGVSTGLEPTSALPGGLSQPGTTGGGQPPPGIPSQPGSGGAPPNQPPPPQTPAPYTPPPTYEEIRKTLEEAGKNAGIQGNVEGATMSSSPNNGILNLPYLVAQAPLATMGMLAKALNYSPGKPNPLNGALAALGTGAASQAAEAGPVTGSMMAFAGEGGATGNYGYGLNNTGAAGDPWVYNQMPGSSKYAQGTGPGGWVFMPPETDLQYARDFGMVPPHTTLSTVYVMVAPGAWFAAGVPELNNGTMKDGYMWGMDSATGDLLWKTHSGSNPAVEAMRFTKTGQNFSWRSGTNFNGVLDHSNTSNRTYTFPDYSGPVGIMLTGSADPSGVVTAPESTMYWDTVADAFYINNNSSTGWTAVSGGGGGGTVTGSGVAGRVAYWTSASNISSDSTFLWDAAADLLSVTGALILTGGGAFTGAPLAITGSATTIVVGYSSSTAASASNTLEINTSFQSSLGGSETTSSFQWGIVDDTAQNGIFNLWNIAGGTLGIKLKVQASQVMTVSGGVTAPGLAWISDPESGWYLIGTDNIGTAINQTLIQDWNATRIKLATAYFFQMGPNAHNFVANDDYLIISNSVNGAIRASVKNTNAAGTSAHCTFDAMNDVGNTCSIGIGGTSFTAFPPHLALEAFVIASNGGGTGSGTLGMMIGNRTASYVRFISSDTERMRLLSGGALVIGSPFTLVGAETLRVVGATYTDGLITGAASLNITGTGTFSSTVTTSRLLAGYAVARTISGGAGQVYLTASPGNSQTQIYFDLREEGANEKLWDINPVLTRMLFRCVNDANNAANEWLSVTRSGFVPTSVVINEDQNDCDFRVEGDSISHLIYTDGTATTENVALLAAAAPNWQTMDRGVFLGDTTNAPTGNPASGGFLWSEAGILSWRDQGGVIWRSNDIITAYKDADESVTNSTTVQADDELTVTLAASTKYRYRVFIYNTTASVTCGFKVSLGGTVGVTSMKAEISIFDDTINATAAMARTTALATTVGAGLGAGDNYAVIEGTIETSTAGTFLLQWAQNTADAVNAVTVQRGSYMELVRVV